jgi:hypothetical protein
MNPDFLKLLRGGSLLDRDLQGLAARWIDADAAARALLRRADHITGAEIVGRNGSGNYSGILIPHVLPGQPYIREYTLRRDTPDREPDAKGGFKERAKYLAPPGRGNMVYFMPDTDPVSLVNTALPLLITEGPFKTIALARLSNWGLGDAAEGPRFLAAGLGGVWNWRGTIGKESNENGDRVDVKGVIPDFSLIRFDGRDVVIAFDADAESNDSVRAARDGLTGELRARGASVRWFRWPLDRPACAKGIDDLLSAIGPDRVLKLIDEAPMPSFLSSVSQIVIPQVSYPEPLREAAFYGVAGKMVRMIEPHSEADPIALLIQSHTAFGSLIGRSAHWRAESDQHFANLYAVLVGQTAKARKGTSWGQVRGIYQSVDPEWFEGHVTNGLASGEGLIWEVRDPIIESQAIKEKGRVVGYQDVQTDPGIQDKRLLVVEPEFARALQVCEREGNTLSAVLRQAWDAGDLRVMTKTSRARATGAHISIVGHITKDELRRFLSDTAVANGFANRFLWIATRRSKLLPEGGNLSNVDFGPIIRQLNAAVLFARGVGLVERDSEARRLWGRVYPQLTEGGAGMFGALTARAEAHVMRLACNYALLDQSDIIRVEHLEAGLEIWRYAEDSVRYIFGEAQGDPTADEILTGVRQRGSAGMTRTEISGLFKRHKGTDDITRALNQLCERGLIRRGQRSGEGRSAEIWTPV